MDEQHAASTEGGAEQAAPREVPATDPAEGTQDEPWYRDGLRFRCTGCGDCCTGEPGAVWVTDDELRAIADHLGKSIGELRLMHTRLVGRRVTLREFANGDCTFFDGESRGCTVYPVRPTQCRTWPFWNSNLKTPETWRRTCTQCPGSGQGDFYSLEQIEQQAAAVDI